MLQNRFSLCFVVTHSQLILYCCVPIITRSCPLAQLFEQFILSLQLIRVWLTVGLKLIPDESKGKVGFILLPHLEVF